MKQINGLFFTYCGLWHTHIYIYIYIYICTYMCIYSHIYGRCDFTNITECPTHFNWWNRFLFQLLGNSESRSVSEWPCSHKLFTRNCLARVVPTCHSIARLGFLAISMLNISGWQIPVRACCLVDCIVHPD